MLPLIVAGCNPATMEDSDVAPKPRAISFEGTIDSAFVGVWKAPSAGSVLELRKDGSAGISNATHGPGGAAQSELTGKWLVSAGNLLLQYTLHNRPPTTVEYPAKLAGNVLTLIHSSKTKVVYTRQSSRNPARV